MLRALLAAIDNAQAVPVGGRHRQSLAHRFGDPAVEVARLALGGDALEELLRRERQDRLTAADQMATVGQADRALVLRAEARIIESYCGTR